MRCIIPRRLACVLPLLWAVAMPVLAETSDLELRPGYMDPKTGVRIEEIVVLPEQDMQAVRLAVPQTDGPIEEIIVTARQRRSGRLIPQLKPHEFVRDDEHGYYGLVIYLGRNETKPLRLYLDAAQQRPGSIMP